MKISWLLEHLNQMVQVSGVLLADNDDVAVVYLRLLQVSPNVHNVVDVDDVLLAQVIRPLEKAEVLLHALYQCHGQTIAR
jgi:hypothetical protein